MKAFILVFLGLVAFCEGTPKQVQVRFRSVEGGHLDLPDYLHVSVEHLGTRDLHIPSSLKLVRNAKIDHMQFFVDDVPSPPDFENVRFYQDYDSSAVITARLVESDGQKVRTFSGSFVKDGKSFAVEPEDIPTKNDGKRHLDSNRKDLHVHVVREMDENETHSIPTDLPDGKDPGNANISRRATEHYDIEMYWVSDPALFKYWKKYHKTGQAGIKEFMGHTYNGVDLVYNYVTKMNKGISMSTWVTQVNILTSGRFEPTDGALTGLTNHKNKRVSVNEDTVLEKMEDYKGTKGWSWNQPDHFMLFTGYDLRDDTVGYAPVGGICTPGRGISAIEYSGSNTFTTAAHELGHNVGMRHDGGNGCSVSAGNVMNPSTVDYSAIPSVRNAFKFSSCSVNDAKKCLFGQDDYKYPRRCLKDTVCSAGITISTPKLPGETMSLDEQCKDTHGDTVQGYCGDNFGKDICKTMYCATGGGRCTASYGGGAANGTPCGQGKWCIEGECKPTNTNPSNLPKSCSNGSPPRVPSGCRDRRNDCTSGNIYKFPGLNCRTFKQDCCSTCTKFGF